MTETAPQTGYAPVNGLEMYYEIHGSGEPLMLLHGAYGSIDLWGPILAPLAERRQVIAVEQQAHGHTADMDRPLSYEQMTEDTAALMRHLRIAHADVFGYSMGGNIGLQLAMRHPELVRKLVAISANYRSDGYYPELLELIQTISPEVFAGSPLEDSYLRNAPDPDNWPVLIDKLKQLDAQEFAWPDEEIRSIAAPTLLVMGDSDAMRPEHMVELFRLLGGGVPGDLTGLPKSQLAVLPGATHVSLVTDQADLLLAVTTAFLDAPMS
jgi:pimeloyl-ACP methyl ester carboxylesterase